MFILTTQEMKAADHYAMNQVGLSSVLMENAGRAVSDELLIKMTDTDKLIVLAGGGHNGGDGFVIARTLHNLAYDVIVFQVVPDEKLVEATGHEKKLFQNCGGEVAMVQPKNISEELRKATLIVDAMTGMGIKGRLRAPLDLIVNEVNRLDTFVCAVDIPSGLPADEGCGDFRAVRADMTVVIGALKESLFVQEMAPFYGEWKVVPIGHPKSAFSNVNPRFVYQDKNFKHTMPRRRKNAHKGSHGRGLLIGGSNQMPGAAILAGKASLKAGAGLIAVASTKRVVDHVITHCPEAMLVELPEEKGEIIPNKIVSFDSYDAVAIGVGLGRLKETGAFLTSVVKDATCPLIIDADGIYHLRSCLGDVRARKSPTIITPHPGEMARLLDMEVSTLLRRPFQYTREFAEQYRTYVVLKGKATIITSPTGKQAVDLSGNAGLAKGGSGDVLTGITLAMVMQNQTIFHALCNACFVHGKSADLQVEDSHTVYDLMATDVIDGIADVYRMILS